MAKVLSRKVTIYINGKEVENTIKSLEAEAAKLRAQQRNLVIGSEEYIETSRKLREIKDVLAQQKNAVEGVADAYGEARKKAAEWSNILVGMKTLWQKGSDLFNWLKGFSDEAARMDDVYADVMKTTGLTHDEVLRLNEAFKQMDTRTAREELNKLASEAGKLGITGVDAVASFTAAADKIRVALGEDLGEDATTVIGKMADVYTRSTKELSDAGDDLGEKMLRIGSAINSLGAASSAAEPHMVDFLARLGGMASQAGLSAQQVLGYASALDQSGVSVEKSATAFQNFMAKMMQKPAEFAAIARQGVNEFRQLMETDMDAAIKAVLAGLNEEGGMTKLAPLFKDLQLSGQGVTTMLTTLKGSIDKVNEAQTIANAQMSSGASIEDEFAVKNNTLQAQMEKAKDKFHDTAETLGNALYPAIIGVTNAGSGLMSGFASLAKFVNGNRWILLSFTTALIALNYAKLKKIATDKLDAIQSRLSNTLTKTGTNLTKLHTAAQDRATLASLKLQKAKIALASSNKTVSYTIDGVRISSDKMTAARNIDLAITRQQDVANKSLGKAMKAVPWGGVITAVSVLAPLMYKLFTHQSKVNEAEKEAARQYGEAEGKLRVLKERLQGAKEGSAEYLEALNELKQEYPDIIQLHLDEKGSIKDLEAAYRDLSAAAKQSVYDRVYAEKSAEAYAEAAEYYVNEMELADVLLDDYLHSQGVSMDELTKEKMPALINEFHRYAKTIKETGNDDEFWRGVSGMVRRLGGRTDGSLSGAETATKFRQTMQAIAQEFKKAEETKKQLKELLNGEDSDPYGYARMSLEELQEELKSATSSMNDMKRQWELWKKEAPDNPNTKTLGENYLHEKKRVEQLTAAIVRLRKAQGDLENNNTDGGGSGSHKETKEEKKARLAREAWERFESSYNSLIGRIGAKTKQGLAAEVAEVDNAIRKMEESLGRVDKSLHPQAPKMLERLRKQAEDWKRVKFDEYVGKIDKEIDKLRKNGAKDSDNEMLNKAKSAAETMRQSYESASATIERMQNDLGGLYAQLFKLHNDESGAAFERRLYLNSEIKQLEERLRLIREARNALTESVFSSIDLSVDTGDFGKKQQVQHREDTDEDLKGLSSLEQFLGVGKEYAKLLDEINAKYDKYREQLEKNAAAARYMAQVEREHGNEEKAEEYEAQADALEKQAEELKGLSDAAKKLAKEDALTKTLDKWIEGFESFGQKALSVWGNITTMLNNRGDQELQDAEKRKDDQLDVLDEQLEQSLISQEEYDKRKAALEQEYSDKEKTIRLEQWERNQALSYGEAVIEGASAVLKALNDKTIPSTAARIAMASVMAAQTLTQIMAIANQPKPYAKGGYVERETIYKAGEAGPEWVASNQLLNDPQTAPMIQALEAYQRGNRRALADIPMAQINMPVATAAARELGRRTVGAMENTLLSMPTATQKFDVNMPDSGEMMKLWQDLATYLKDPNNRRAVISRQTMTDFETNEQFLRNKARL